jgi:RimJ/RimL family protein N-acetyltransferase
LVREAANCDIPLMLQIFDEVIKEGVFLGAEKLLPRHRMDFLDHIKDRKSLTLVAIVDGTIVGNLNVWPTGLHKMKHLREISMLIVKGYREIGVGTALMDYGLNWARRKKDIEKIVLGVFSSNKRAYGLYKKFGFKVEGVLKRQHILKGKYADELRMAVFI